MSPYKQFTRGKSMKKAKKLLTGLLAMSCVCSLTLGTAMADTKMVEVSFQGNDGEFTVQVGDDRPWTTPGFSSTFAVGSKVADAGYVVGKPVFWDSSRDFEGWQLCVMEEWTDDGGNTHMRPAPVEGVEIMTSSNAATNYEIPDHDIYFYAVWDGNDDDYYSQVYINGYNTELKLEIAENDKMVPVSTYVWGNILRESNETLKEQTKTYMSLMSDPERSDAIFEGWAKFKVTTDDDGNGTYELVSDKIYTTAEIMDMKIPSYDVAYVAKWSDIALDDYFHFSGPDNDGDFILVGFDGNGGSFEHVAGGMQMNSVWHGKGFEAGSTVADTGDTMNDPVFWDSARKFLGWQLCVDDTVYDDDGDAYNVQVPVEGVGLFTTKEAMEYTIPDHDIYFVAQWDGDYYDYYSRVDVMGYGAEFTIYDILYDDNNQLYKDEVSTEWWGNELKENGESLRQQASSYTVFGSEPTRADATFEGWAEFKVEWTYDGWDMNGEYTLVSTKIYTTDEMLDKAVPDYDVAYVAKWSDIDLDEYFVDEGDNSNNNNSSKDDDDDRHSSSSSKSSGTTVTKTETPSVGVVATDAKKGQVNSVTGIVTGDGAGYSKWVAENGANGNTEWKFQYADGTMAAGSMKVNENGVVYAQPAWEQINGAWYAFGVDGYAESGWVYDADLAGWFYVDINKGMLTDWQFVDGKWYYLQVVSDGKKGIMYASTWVDGWYVDASGAWDWQPQVKN